MAFVYGANCDGIEAGKVEIYGRVVRSTEKAIQIDDGTGQHWLPISKIHMEEAKGGLTRVLMPQWLAKEKRLI